MRLRMWILLLLVSGQVLYASDARIIKVLPQLLDKHGRNAISPSLFDRDAYQLHLRQNPEEISALRFEVQYKAKEQTPLLLRIEVRGSKTQLGKHYVFETKAEPTGWLPKWGRVQLDRATAEQIGTIVSWRASLVKDGIVIAEQESFLW